MNDGGFDWAAVAHELAVQPLQQVLAIISDTVAAVVQDLDVWLYDYQYAIVESPLTHHQQRPIALATQPIHNHPDLIVTPLQVHGDQLGFLTAHPSTGVAYHTAASTWTANGPGPPTSSTPSHDSEQHSSHPPSPTPAPTPKPYERSGLEDIPISESDRAAPTRRRNQSKRTARSHPSCQP